MGFYFNFLNTYDRQEVTFSVRRGGNFRPEWHEKNLELNILLHGSAQVTIANSVYDLQSGQIFIVNPGEIHTVKCFGEAECLLFSMSIPSPLRDFLRTHTLPVFDHTLYPEESEVVMMIFTTLLDNSFHLNPLNKEREAFLVHLLISLLPIYDPENPRPSFTSTETQTLNRMLMEINFNYKHGLLLKEIASKENRSSGYLSSLFKSKFNITYHKFLEEVKLKKGIELLYTTNLSSEAISEEVGFPNPYAFAREFKRRFTLSPHEYRKKNKNEPVIGAKYLFIHDKSDINNENFPFDSILIKEFLDEYSSLSDICKVNKYSKNHIFPAYSAIREILLASDTKPVAKHIWLKNLLQFPTYYQDILENSKMPIISLYISFELDFRKVWVQPYQSKYDFSALYKGLDFLKENVPGVSVRLVFVNTEEKLKGYNTLADDPVNLFNECQMTYTFIKMHYGSDMVHSWVFLTEKSLSCMPNLQKEDF